MFASAVPLKISHASATARQRLPLSCIAICNMMLAMRVITNRRLLEFAARYADAGEPLQAWRKVMEAGNYGNFAGLRQVFRGVDKVGDLHVFNIAGNKYRLVAYLHFGRQLCYIKHVLTHVEYDKGGWKK